MSFRGDNFFLSNFYPVTVEMDGMIYPSVEHAYQAARTWSQVDRIRIRNVATCTMAKRLGRSLQHIREDWDTERLRILRQLLMQKFDPQQHPDLALKLQETGDAELIEDRTWRDEVWGICEALGENTLGRLLMEVREHYRKTWELC